MGHHGGARGTGKSVTRSEFARNMAQSALGSPCPDGYRWRGDQREPPCFSYAPIASAVTPTCRRIPRQQKSVRSNALSARHAPKVSWRATARIVAASSLHVPGVHHRSSFNIRPQTSGYSSHRAVATDNPPSFTGRRPHASNAESGCAIVYRHSRAPSIPATSFPCGRRRLRMIPC
jgi:hypothetical protein